MKLLLSLWLTHWSLPVSQSRSAPQVISLRHNRQPDVLLKALSTGKISLPWYPLEGTPRWGVALQSSIFIFRWCQANYAKLCVNQADVFLFDLKSFGHRSLTRKPQVWTEEGAAVWQEEVPWESGPLCVKLTCLRGCSGSVTG